MSREQVRNEQAALARAVILSGEYAPETRSTAESFFIELLSVGSRMELHCGREESVPDKLLVWFSHAFQTCTNYTPFIDAELTLYFDMRAKLMKEQSGITDSTN